MVVSLSHCYNGIVKRICEDATIGIRRFRLEDAEPLAAAVRESIERISR